MNRRGFIKQTAVTLLLSSALQARAQSNGQHINILFLMDDQHRGDALGCDGANYLRTPHLDQLAAEGIRFTKAYTTSPSCLPARAALLTGMSPWGHGLLQYTNIPRRYAFEKPRAFTEAGFRTISVGKTHFQGPSHGYETVILEEAWRGVTREKFACDYRKWFAKNKPEGDVDATGLSYTDHRGNRPWPYEEYLHPTNWTAQQAIDFLEGYDEKRPWFLKVSFKRPHPPFDPPKRLLDEYINKNLPKAKVGDWAEEAYGSFTGTVEKTPNAPRGNYPASDIHDARAAYYASITHVDEQIGRVIEAVKERGELENTFILFTADHGDMMGDQHLWRKTYAYEPSTRVPMLVRWPAALDKTEKANRGLVSNKLVELRDVLPTFLDAAGLKIPEHIEGASMLDIVAGKDDNWRTILDLEHGECYWKENAWVALTDGRYKYIYFTRTGQEQLFDLQQDPHELHDLEGKESEILKTWRGNMIKHLEIRGEPWVKDGQLNTFTQKIPHSPNFPKA